MAVYTIHFFEDLNREQQPGLKQSIFKLLNKDTLLFPPILQSNNTTVSPFSKTVLIIIFTTMVLFELISFMAAFFIFKKTTLIIGLLKVLVIPRDGAEIIENGRSSEVAIRNRDSEHVSLRLSWLVQTPASRGSSSSTTRNFSTLNA